MNTIQKKGLEHIKKTLESFDTFNVYHAISKSIEEQQFPPESQKKIMEAFNNAMGKESKKIKEAKEWTEAILADK